VKQGNEGKGFRNQKTELRKLSYIAAITTRFFDLAFPVDQIQLFLFKRDKNCEQTRHKVCEITRYSKRPKKGAGY